MKKISVLTLAATSALIVGGLASCGSKDDGPKVFTLQIASPADHHELLSGLFAEFNAERVAAGEEEIAAKFLDYGEGDVLKKVTDWEVGPDLFAFASDQIVDFNARGILSELPTDSRQHVETTMLETVVPFAELAGKTLAYPFSADNTYYLTYDKRVLSDEDVTTIEGLLAKAGELGKKVSYNLGTAFFGIGALFTYGAKYDIKFNEDGGIIKTDANFNTDAGLKAAKAIRQIVTNPNWISTEVCPDSSDDKAPIATVTGTWNAAAYTEILGENLGIVKLPTVTVGEETAPLGAFLGGKLYGVNAMKDIKHVQIAHEFAKFLTSEHAQQVRFEKKNVAPTNATLAASPDVLADKSIKAVDAQRPQTTPQTAVPGSIWGAYDAFWKNISAKFGDHANEITDEWLQTEMTTLNNAVTKL